MPGGRYGGRSAVLPEGVRNALPEGVEVYRLGPDGEIALARRDGEQVLGPEREFLRFIDAGQFARYLVGDAATSPERPSNATVKLGVVGPRSAFTPHAHGGEHFVLSLGHAACGLSDVRTGRVVDVPLRPGMLIRIPELMPHSFANRARRPLTILAANTGYGIDHEDYAITAAEAERRVAREPADGGPLAVAAPVDYRVMGAALRDIERLQRERGIGAVTVRERAAAHLRRLAAALEGPR